MVDRLILELQRSGRRAGLPLAGVLLLTVSALAIQPSVFRPIGHSVGEWMPERPKTLFYWRMAPPPEEEDEDVLATDRPDFTESSSTVGLRRAQIELGYTFVSDGSGTTSLRQHSAPETLLRVGMLAEWFELRIGYNHLVERERDGNTRTTRRGSEDLYLGIKLALTEQQGIWPEMALMPQLTVPTGSGGFSDGEVLPGMAWLYGWNISERWALGGQTIGDRRLDPVTGQPYGEWAQSLTVIYQIFDPLSWYTEWFVIVPDGADSVRTEHYLNGGFAWLVTNNLQFDVRAGVGLNEAADDFFTGAGMAFRY